MASRLSREEEKQIVELHLHKKSKKEISEITGRSKEAITKVLGIYGLDDREVDKYAWDDVDRELWKSHKRLDDIPYEKRMELFTEKRQIIVRKCNANFKSLMSDSGFYGSKFDKAEDALIKELDRLKDENEQLINEVAQLKLFISNMQLNINKFVKEHNK